MKYEWYDMQDNQDSHSGTLEDAKEWLLDFWLWNPYNEEDLEDMPEYDVEEHHESIRGANDSELDEMMQGIGWALDKIK